MKRCPSCSGESKVIAAIIETGAIEKILPHLGLLHKPPGIAPVRISLQMSFMQLICNCELSPAPPITQQMRRTKV